MTHKAIRTLLAAPLLAFALVLCGCSDFESELIQQCAENGGEVGNAYGSIVCLPPNKPEPQVTFYSENKCLAFHIPSDAERKKLFKLSQEGKNESLIMGRYGWEVCDRWDIERCYIVIDQTRNEIACAPAR